MTGIATRGGGVVRQSGGSRRWTCVAAGVIATLASLGPMATSTRAQEGSLNGEMQRLVNARRLGAARVGIAVHDSRSGTMLATINPEQTFIPASNQKLLTSGVAASVLGPDFVFRTEFVLDGDRLIVRGAGDPVLADPELLSSMRPPMDVGDLLTKVGEAIRQAGATSLREVVIDDRVFDREHVHPDWPKEQLHNRYAAQVGGVNFHGNAIAVFMKPSREGVGRPPSLTLRPEAPWLSLTNRARTVGSGRNSAWLQREHGTNDVVVTGDVRTDDSAQVTIDGPGLFLGRSLASRLEAMNVSVGEGSTRAERVLGAVRLADSGEALGQGRVVAVITTPIAEVLRRCNTDSDNLSAEALLKRAAHAVTNEPGSWPQGQAVLRMMLTEKIGATAASETVISDGSGLSRRNLVSPLTLVRWLDVMAEDPRLGGIYIDSMAEPGSGTLRRRFNEPRLRNELHAKSGFIRGVRALSGYIIDPETGRRVTFAVLVNDIKGDETDFAARSLAEDVVRRLDRWLADRSEPKTNVGG